VCTPQGVGCSAFTGEAALACLTAVDCMRSTHCAIDGDASYCYCGSASIDDGSCASAPLGVCKAELESADPNVLPDDGVLARFNKVAVDFTDPGLPIGQATQLLGCLSYFCNTPDTCAGQF
jgi:hypothetical protein